MQPLTRKLWRDLFRFKGQAAAIALVVACGLMTFIVSAGTIATLKISQGSFYREYRFADVFAQVKRAPESLLTRMAAIPGVARVETRIQAGGHIELDDFNDSITGLFVSLPGGRQPDLNALHLVAGRLPARFRHDEVVLSQAFAEAHGLQPGQPLRAIIHGRLQHLIITGIALSPEFVYQIRPGDLVPDYRRYGVFWLNREALASATGLDGAFNNVVASLSVGASSEAVIEQLDLLLSPYGSTGAYDRDQQFSHQFLREEIRQLESSGTIMPVIFLAVAAFLLNVVMARLIRTQREQIAILKAFGYSAWVVGKHYLYMTLLIVTAGAIVGVALGSWLASGLAALYTEFFRFPALIFQLSPALIVSALIITLLAAGLGAAQAVWQAVKLPPAEAMRPPAPARFRASVLERGWLGRRLTPASRVILRNLERHPLKVLLSVLGIGLSGGLLIVGNFQSAAVDRLIDVQFRHTQTLDARVQFHEPVAMTAATELADYPEVIAVEPLRILPVRLRFQHRQQVTSLTGLLDDSVLMKVVDEQIRRQRIPGYGLLLTDHLARTLGVAAGDFLEVEVLEGRQQRLRLPVSGVVHEYVGVASYLEFYALHNALHEAPAMNVALLALREGGAEPLQQHLREAPAVAGVSIKQDAIRAIQHQLDETMLVFALVNLLLALSITFAVVYNNARIAFAERARELATLRVLGFYRQEVAYILFGELWVLTLLALPLGAVLGSLFAWLISTAMATDLFRIPLVLTPAIFAQAGLAVMVATLLSLGFLLKHVQRLDMVAALKSLG